MSVPTYAQRHSSGESSGESTPRSESSGGGIDRTPSSSSESSSSSNDSWPSRTHESSSESESRERPERTSSSSSSSASSQSDSTYSSEDYRRDRERYERQDAEQRAERDSRERRGSEIYSNVEAKVSRAQSVYTSEPAHSPKERTPSTKGSLPPHSVHDYGGAGFHHPYRYCPRSFYGFYHEPYSSIFNHTIIYNQENYYTYIYGSMKHCVYFDWYFCFSASSNGYYVLDGYPYMVYNNYRHRYSSKDLCRYQLIDSWTRRVVEDFPVNFCSDSYDKCAVKRDKKNALEEGFRFECAETFRKSDYQNFNWFKESFYSKGSYQNTANALTDYYYDTENDPYFDYDYSGPITVTKTERTSDGKEIIVDEKKIKNQKTTKLNQNASSPQDTLDY
jgi:hypothetical protein